MGRTSMQRSLMEFNSRVLAQGTPDPDEVYDTAGLCKLLFFNRVFLTNTEEMFRKHDVKVVLDDYNDSISQYLSNIKHIVGLHWTAPVEDIFDGTFDQSNIPVGKDQRRYVEYIRMHIRVVDEIKSFISFSQLGEKRELPNHRAISIRDIFERDHLAEYPRDSFDEYLHLLREAAWSKDVEAIYVTLYRIGDDDTIFRILKTAVQNGIFVHVNIELKASGEEFVNTKWMDQMIEAGIHVTTYASGELKVHCKLTLVTFKSGKAITQIGTGNYHTKTTSQYTDLSLVTSDPEICSSALKLFSILQGYSRQTFDNQFLVSRYNVRQRLVKLIDREGKKGVKGYIAMKCNALDDDEIIEHLESAAVKGCRMDLVVRGVCTWVPSGLPHVKIRSIVWDKLEHSRVYCFSSNNPTIYIGSMDLVTKKMDKRIETLIRVKDPDVAIQICNYMNRYITNTKNSWIQTESGIYVKEK